MINSRASLISNYEVLTLLRELEADYHSKSKTAQCIKKEDEAAGNAVPRAYNPLDDISENAMSSSRSSSRASTVPSLKPVFSNRSSSCDSRLSAALSSKASLDTASFGSVVGDLSGVRVAVLIAMPSPDSSRTPEPSCLGLVDV